MLGGMEKVQIEAGLLALALNIVKLQVEAVCL